MSAASSAARSTATRSGARTPRSAKPSAVSARPSTSPTSGKNATERPRSSSRSGPLQTGIRVRKANAATRPRTPPPQQLTDLDGPGGHPQHDPHDREVDLVGDRGYALVGVAGEIPEDAPERRFGNQAQPDLVADDDGVGPTPRQGGAELGDADLRGVRAGVAPEEVRQPEGQAVDHDHLVIAIGEQPLGQVEGFLDGVEAVPPLGPVAGDARPHLVVAGLGGGDEQAAPAEREGPRERAAALTGPRAPPHQDQPRPARRRSGRHAGAGPVAIARAGAVVIARAPGVIVTDGNTGRRIEVAEVA